MATADRPRSALLWIPRLGRTKHRVVRVHAGRTTNSIQHIGPESIPRACNSDRFAGDSSSHSRVSTEVTRARANGGRGPTLRATVSPARGRRDDGRRAVWVFGPAMICGTYTWRNQRVFMADSRTTGTHCRVLA